METRFILPLLERLGHEEEDRADGYTVEIYEGVRKATEEEDFVLFDGPSRIRDNALLVIEAKGAGGSKSTSARGGPMRRRWGPPTTP